MSHKPRYRPYHPRLYRTRMPIFWWVHKRAHVRFILRELTSLFVAFYALGLVWLVRALAEGPAAYAAFLEALQTPAALVFNAFGFAMLLFHSVTWFNLAPKAMVVQVGERRLPGALIAGGNYAAWLVVSAGLAWTILSA